MARIIDYPIVLKELTKQGLKCNYYNSGAFGFPTEANAEIRGWIGPGDATILPAMRSRTRSISPPYESTLARMCCKIWQENLPGRAWVMPASHWAHELHFGSNEWLPDLLKQTEIDPENLKTRNNGAAIEFQPTETAAFAHFTQTLLEMLQASDFIIAFPTQNTVCTLHHHKQLWWTTTDPTLVDNLNNITLEQSS